MKKFTLLFTLVVCFLLANAQAPRYPLFEEFTNSSCGPCAAQNPTFEANILTPNPATVRQISYHVNWPSPNDPMYLADQSDIDERINYYAVMGVPDVVLLGNVNEQGPAAYTQADVDAINSQTSPIKIKVVDTDNGTSHDVAVTITSVGTPPSGTFKLRNVIIERMINWANPGGNGETEFPNVCRKMLPDATGDDITLPSVGNSITFNYSYDEDPAWDMSQIGFISFIQNVSTKEIINCGAFPFDPDAALSNPPVLTQAGTLGNISSFDIACNNYGTATTNFSVSLTNNAPGDWVSNFVVNGNTYNSSATVSLDAGANTTITVNVTPGSTAAIGIYTLTVTNLNDPSQFAVSKTVYVFSGITDLVVNGVGAQGDGSGATPDSWQDNFVNGLINAGCTTYGVIGGNIADRASTENSLTGVQNIYYNVGWSFPAFNDSWVASLETLMDNGVNLFVSGQDIGWDVWTDASAYGHATVASQDFYTNYLFSEWLDDGGSTNNILTAVSTDAVFGTFSNMSIQHFYGNTYYYPDQIAPAGIGTAIFNYNGSTRVGGVRADNGTFKVVYLAPGLEMFSASDASNVMNTTYDWFHGITGIDNANASTETIGNSYPNPSDDATYIPLNGVKEATTFMITNMLGQVMITKKVDVGTSLLKLNTAGLPQGIYRYYLLGNEKNTSHSLQVVH